MAQNQEPSSYLRHPDLEFTSPNQLTYHASFNPSKYLRNLVFLPSESLQLEEFSSKLGRFNSQRLCRKYFSKKTVHIICSSEHSKKIKFSKRLKKLTLIQPRHPLKCPPNALKHLSIHETNLHLQTKSQVVRKLTGSCKRLEHLFYNQMMNNYFLRSIQKLVNLQVISLVLTDNQIIRNGHAVSNLKHLERVKILVRESHIFKTPQKIAKFIAFFQKLVGREKLATFEVNLQRSELGRDEECLENLIDTVSQSQIEEYNIQVMLDDNSSLQMSKIGPFLRKCDFLGLHSFGRTSVPTLALNHPLSAKKKCISEAQRKTSQNKKVFEVTFQKIYEPFLLELVRGYQASSIRKALFINLQEIGTSFGLLTKFSRLENLNNLIVDLENLPDKFVKNFTFGLARALNKASSLENLTLSDSNPWIYTNSTADASSRILQDQLSQMDSLRKLHIENLTMNALSWKNLQEILKSLPNLENLYFSLRLKQNQPASEMNLPFDELKNLQKLRLNTSGLITPTGLLLQLINNIQKLEKLKVFEVFGEGFKNVGFDQFQEFLGKLKTLKKLAKIRISLTLNYAEIPQNEGMNVNDFIARLRETIQDLFYQNINLKELYIYQSNWFEFKYIR